jgi:membrane protease YdiL (CAAX protease family)
MAALLAPLCEELAFRGHLLPLLRARLPARAAIVTGALAFAAMHFDPVRLASVFLLGCVFGWLAWRSGSLWPAVAAHAGNNGVAALLLLGGAGDRGDAAAAGEAVARPPALAALLAAIFGAALVLPLLAWFRRLTPEPPGFEDALLAADPGAPRSFALRRVPRGVWIAALAGAGSLAALVALG